MRFCNSAVALLSAVLVLSSNVSFAQAANDPLVGSWNFTTNIPAVAVRTFNAGGTTAEFDSAGTNPSGSPGESISLGHWRKNTNGTYSFKEENYIYDNSGNLFLVAVTTGVLTLGATSNILTGTAKSNFYHCSASVCPGAFFSGPVPFNFTGRRF